MLVCPPPRRALRLCDGGVPDRVSMLKQNSQMFAWRKKRLLRFFRNLAPGSPFFDSTAYVLRISFTLARVRAVASSVPSWNVPNHLSHGTSGSP